MILEIKKFLKKILLLLLFMYVCVSVCVIVIQRLLDPLEVEFQVIVSHCCGCWESNLEPVAEQLVISMLIHLPDPKDEFK